MNYISPFSTYSALKIGTAGSNPSYPVEILTYRFGRGSPAVSEAGQIAALLVAAGLDTSYNWRLRPENASHKNQDLINLLQGWIDEDGLNEDPDLEAQFGDLNASRLRLGSL